MGMPIAVEVVDKNVTLSAINLVFNYFQAIDKKFSTYNKDSEISQINRHEIQQKDYTQEMKEIFALAEKTKRETDGYFDISHNGLIDPSGVVKGWAIFNAAQKLKKVGFKNFYIEAGGDIQVSGKNKRGQKWRVGIRNPFNPSQIVKTVLVEKEGVATSGTYLRGQHIYRPASAGSTSSAYNPKIGEELNEIVSLTVIGPNILEADRFATAAFAMSERGIKFIENLVGFEGYQIDKNGLATFTIGFEKYIVF